MSTAQQCPLQANRRYCLPAPCCCVLFFVLLFTRFWLISALYATWWFIDWDTPSRGGRRIDYLCNLSVWRHMRDYFPVQADLEVLFVCQAAGPRQATEHLPHDADLSPMALTLPASLPQHFLAPDSTSIGFFSGLLLEVGFMG
ncbi:hypothetical protein SKAU_G00001050 [Synaphobranchus kaupii]|uniref:Uncharacterized protein n=1 Tax=Synaphobranchus kaupii TaxID=118154 RepID=A0A9Q1G8E2_SYNKA|nr:hypothetical protein SKAU_G00001050 [Synaphobranchus kaupii]